MSSSNLNVNFRFPLIGAAFYFALGLIYHLVTGPDEFSWSNPWVYIDMAFWPFFLLGWIIVLVLAMLALCFAGFWVSDTWKNRKTGNR